MIQDVRLPENWSKGSSGGPGFQTDIVPLASGAEDREERWAAPLWSFDIAHNAKRPEDISQLRGFHLARRGAARGFLLKDWIDYSSKSDGISTRSALDQPLINSSDGTSTGDGAETVFQLVKRYEDDADFYDRPILWPVDGTVAIAAAGVPVLSGFTVDRGAGTVTFDVAPADGDAMTAGFEFDVPVRFKEDSLTVSWDTINSRSAGQVTLIELREDD